MASALIKHDLIKKYSTTWMDALRDGKSELVNTNKLVRYYKGATGLKTGTTSSAGCCVAATAERDGMELVAVVMKGENSNERFSGAKKLLDYGFANWEFMSLNVDESELGEIKCKNGLENIVIPEISDSVNLLIEKGKKDKVERKIEITENLKAPINLGDKLGKITFTLDGKKVGEIGITAAKSIEKVGFFNSLVRILLHAFVP
jgi:D-alanyl-D-alanine carboxypeptidase (penicillin-binding protein 5/6)